MKKIYILISVITLLFLSGCAVVRPVTQLAGGVVGMAGSAAGMAANVAIKAAPVVLPFLI